MKLRPCRSARICLLAGTVLFGFPASAVRASTPIQLTKISYDSPGKDDRSSSSLNAEYVVVRNSGSSMNLKSWTLRDKSNHVFAFPSFTLAKGKSVTVHTGKGKNNSTNLYWGSGNYIWNNEGDAATLKNGNGETIDDCSYRSSGSSVNC